MWHKTIGRFTQILVGTFVGDQPSWFPLAEEKRFPMEAYKNYQNTQKKKNNNKGLLNYRVLIRIWGENHIISNLSFRVEKGREENGIGGFGQTGIGGIAETIGEEAKIWSLYFVSKISSPTHLPISFPSASQIRMLFPFLFSIYIPIPISHYNLELNPSSFSSVSFSLVPKNWFLICLDW